MNEESQEYSTNFFRSFSVVEDDPLFVTYAISPLITWAKIAILSAFLIGAFLGPTWVFYPGIALYGVYIVTCWWPGRSILAEIKSAQEQNRIEYLAGKLPFPLFGFAVVRVMKTGSSG